MSLIEPRRLALVRNAGPSGEVLDHGSEISLLDRTQPARGHAPAAPLVVRVLIADGQALVRAGFRALLEAGRCITVVAEAATGEQAITLGGRTRPDVALIDARLPGLDRVEAASRTLSESGVAVVLLTTSEDDERNLAALRAGASGLLLKDAEPAELVRAVQFVARGESPLSPQLARSLIAELASRPEPSVANPELLDELTAREREVLTLVGLGLTNGEIAERLVVSPATAKTHVWRTMMKLHAHDRAKLVVFAYETGLVTPRTR